MSLLTRYLNEAQRAALTKRQTSNGFSLKDVTRSGALLPDSAIGIYAPDSQSYAVFREVFDPILDHFRVPPPKGCDRPCLNPNAIVSTRVRVARILSGFVFPAGMSRLDRLIVEAKVARACEALAPDFPGWIRKLGDIPKCRLAFMVSRRMAFGPEDKYMAAAGIHADWPIGRSVFNSRRKQLSVWVNEEDHVRIAVVFPGACVGAGFRAIDVVMMRLGAHLDFCKDAERGYLTSCPSNAGSAMRVSYRIDLSRDPSQEAILEQMEAAGILTIRSAAGEHALRGGLVDVSLRNRVGLSVPDVLHNMDGLLLASPC